MREFLHTTLYPFNWTETALSVINKYPNAYAPHVVSMDVLDQQYDPGSGRLRLERILGVRQAAPGWARTLLGGLADTFVREVTLVDPCRSRVEQTSTNMSLAEYLLVREHVVYAPGDIEGPQVVPPSPFKPLHDSEDVDNVPSAANNLPHRATVSPSIRRGPLPRIPSSSPWTSFSQVADIEARIGTSANHAFVPKRMLHKLEHRIEEWSVARFGDNAGKGKLGLSSILQTLWGPPDPSLLAMAEASSAPVAPLPPSSRPKSSSV